MCVYRLNREKDNPDIFQIESDTIHVEEQLGAICFRHDPVFFMKLDQCLEKGKRLCVFRKLV